MYKRVFISLLGFGFCAGCHPQSIIDTVSYRFVYDVQAKTYEINDRLFPDEHWLERQHQTNRWELHGYPASCA